MSALLSVRDAHVAYGKVEAVRSVSLAVGENEIVTIIGANGAGKTTLLNAIMGVLPLKGRAGFLGDCHDVGCGPAHAAEGLRDVDQRQTGVGDSRPGRLVEVRLVPFQVPEPGAGEQLTGGVPQYLVNGFGHDAVLSLPPRGVPRWCRP